MRAGLKDRAAAAYEKGAEYETAAKLYEEAGHEARAAELYGRAGQTFKSGEAAARAGEREKAIALLQRVGPHDDNYRPATELLARLFIEARMPALALERVQKAIGNQEVGPGNLDLYYWLGLAHEAHGHAREALTIYEKIRSEDLSFRDVEKRASHLRGVVTASLPVVNHPLAATLGQPPPFGARCCRSDRDPGLAPGARSRRLCLPPHLSRPCRGSGAGRARRPQGAAVRAPRGNRPWAPGRPLPRRGPDRRPECRPAHLPDEPYCSARVSCPRWWRT